MRLSLADVREATGGQWTGAIPPEQLDANGWSIDSRTVAPGDVFFAIQGERLDGHAFVADVLARGASAAIVSQPAPNAVGPQLQVVDVLQALQTLAHSARRRWGRPIVAVTGSAGKTSTKDIVAALLSARLRTGKTVGNFNNHIGLPLSILRLADDCEAAVLEMGMNHAGEIRELARIAEPDHGIVTNVGFAHVENFESIDGVAAAKRELIEELPANGVAIVNADDDRVVRFAASHQGRSVTYGFSPAADVRAVEAELSSDRAAFTVDGVRFQTNLAGRHSVLNILAGIAAAGVFGIPLNELVAPVAVLAPGKMRGERSTWRGITVLNDSYNSNPEAARNMIDVLMREPAARRIAVLGEMRELGHMSAKLHADLGTYAAQAGIDVVIGIRGDARLTSEQARQPAYFFDSPEAAGDFLKTFVTPGDAVLFKGSRGTQVETALARMES